MVSSKNKIFLMVAVSSLLLFAQNPVFAEEGSTSSSKTKTWYINFGLGYAGTNYSHNSTVTTFVSQQKTAGKDSMPLSVDLGFYWPVGMSSLMGISDVGFSDAYSSPSSSSINNPSVISSMLAVSYIHYFHSQPAAGLFLRGDAGLASTGTSTSFLSFSGRSSGLGLLAQGGYCFHVSDSISLPLSAGYYYATGSGNVSAYLVDLAIMW